MYRVPLIELTVPLPAGRIIPAGELTELLQQAAGVRHADLEAKGIINAARRKAERILQEAKKNCRETEASRRREFRAWQRDTLRRLEARWLRKHVIRLVRDEALEQALVSAVSDRIHHCIEQVLSAWFGQQPPDKTLCARLALQAEQMAGEGVLTLQCHPDLQQSIKEAFGSRFVLLAAPELPPDSVVLASSQLSVTFSPEGHFQQLLQWLRPSGADTGDENESL
ncbi:type III secretion system stator protein SctL [Morganella sp. GD04133]|uniref:type III secretion system stator protein SctL n=1 Tax=Morganella sp. GD04133 TaxID=2975435 RepID=UPI00244D3AA4|nr:type III secretion system stator protein SctL [Morganella sp. GD04133]MDH0354248.1 type III secretion system stator protein SctL [Morganella sp. GD04133]